MTNIGIILISVFFSSLAQILMRKGMLQVGVLNEVSQMGQALPLMASNSFLWLALLLYGLGFFSWLVVLSRVEVSFAYLFTSLAFVFITVMSVIFLKETVSVLRLMGLVVICLGIILVARSY